MSISQSVQIAFEDSDSGLEANTLFLEERASDNKMPSVLYRESQIAEGIATGVCITKEAEEASNALAVQLCLDDLAAWGTRRLRLYPANILPELRTTLGTVTRLGVGGDNVSEVLQFSGTDEVSLKFPAQSMTFGEQVFYDENGDITVVNFTFDGNRKVRASEEGYGLVFVTYSSNYNIIELKVTPTGESLDALIIAIYRPWGAAASANVNFTPEVCDVGGAIAGCEDITDIEEETYATVFDSHVSSITPYDGIGPKPTVTWTEDSRTEEVVSVSGVDIARMTRVTFDAPSAKVVLVFNNPL